MHKHGSDPQLQVFFDIEQAVHDLSSRALHTAARWAAEQLNGLDASVLQCAAAFISAGTAGTVQLDAQDRHPLFMLARQHMEFKEYYRAATVLSGVPGPKALFLRCYSRYLAGEKRREEEVLEQGPGQGKAAGGGTGAAGREGAGLPGTLQGPGGVGAAGPVNKELDPVEAELVEAAGSGVSDPFCQYLLGLVLLDK